MKHAYIRIRAIRATALATLALVCIPAVPFSPPDDVEIVMHVGLGIPGTFSATGAIVDSGGVTVESAHFGAPNSPVVGTAHYLRTFHGANGSITMRVQVLLSGTSIPWIWAESGQWVIEDSTGAYAGLHGQGHEAGLRNFISNTLDATFSGQVH